MITLEMISTRELIGRAQYKAENDIKFMYNWSRTLWFTGSNGIMQRI